MKRGQGCMDLAVFEMYYFTKPNCGVSRPTPVTKGAKGLVCVYVAITFNRLGINQVWLHVLDVFFRMFICC